MSKNSALYSGSVMHQRLRPARHRLRYRVFSLLVDLDELPDLARRLRLFSLNRFNLFSLHERDHGAGLERGLRSHVDAQLHAAGLATGGAIRLLSMPRTLGHVFNPLSVYFCHRPDGPLQALLYEVNNTFGERHSYLIEVDPAMHEGETIVQSCAKGFHVSPFLALDMTYRFGIDAPHPDRGVLRISITASDADGPVLIACFDARRRVLDDKALALAFMSHPLLTLKVVVAIHWEALRLWAKGVRLHPRPPPPLDAMTIIKRKNR
ncbi:DUF1365 domain-containing protein [Variovorax sp. J22R115]|uniref:DUF1365 domain-containing protein n=1 Tax=Variovorax sp. J22R115 TaxID=3053509 RepID=UPI002578AFF8|nr:DUF1365 family protein [Variovorax sp. J22R115]MDM0047583.1 DUF1365 family protein [Variovorax sp. J22R115]